MHYTERKKYDRAREHYRAFLATFSQPDPPYAWMVTEALRELERPARDR